MGSILCLSLVLIITRNNSNKNLTSSSSTYTKSVCPSSSQMITLLRFDNTIRFNYTYYSYLYKAISSNDTSTFYIDYLIQNLNTTKGQIYNISFWIKNRSAPVNKLTVAIIYIRFFLSFFFFMLILDKIVYKYHQYAMIWVIN